MRPMGPGGRVRSEAEEGAVCQLSRGAAVLAYRVVNLWLVLASG